MIIVRYVDDFIIGFEHENDAALSRRDARAVREVCAVTASREDPAIEFGRSAAECGGRRGLGKPETFNFLGFTFDLRQDPRGQIPYQKEDSAGPHAGEAEDDQSGDVRRMHQPIPLKGSGWEGLFAATSTTMQCRPNARALDVFRHRCHDLCGARRGVEPKDRLTWARIYSRRKTGSRNRSSSILGRAIALPSHTRGGSRMRESRTYGSVRGAYDETHVPTATAARVHHACRRCGPRGRSEHARSRASACRRLVCLTSVIKRRIRFSSPGCGAFRQMLQQLG